MKETLGLSVLLSSRQVHGDRIVSVVGRPDGDMQYEGYDALITNIAGIGLLIQQADCQAVLLYDSIGGVVANIHSGWKGSVYNIIGKTIGQMNRDFATDPKNLHVVISPSLGPCCAEFKHYRSELPLPLHAYQVQPNHFDFWAISREQLLQAGVKPENIHNLRICTVCDDRFFSYRREGVTGRFASVIGLKQ